MFHCRSRLAPQTEELPWPQPTRHSWPSVKFRVFFFFSLLVCFPVMACGACQTPHLLSLTWQPRFPMAARLVCVYECRCVCVLYPLCHSSFLHFISVFQFGFKLLLWLLTPLLGWFVPPSPRWNQLWRCRHYLALHTFCLPPAHLLFFPGVSQLSNFLLLAVCEKVLQAFHR